MLSNAIKYTKRGYVKLSAKLKTFERMSNVIFEIEDSGVGMDQNAIDRLF